MSDLPAQTYTLPAGFFTPGRPVTVTFSPSYDAEAQTVTVSVTFQGDAPDPPPLSATQIVAVGLGGSITAGAGAGGAEFSWWELMIDALAQRYPAASIAAVNAGAGGTPSWYGLVRLQQQVIGASPTLIFVDFAVNDTSGDGAGFAPAAEALIRRLLWEAPNAKIVPMILCFPDGYSHMTATRRASRDKWLALSAHYGIPTGTTPLRLDVGMEAQMPTPYTNADVQVYFPANGGVHPNAYGHALIAQLAQPFIEDLTPNAPVPMPERLDPASADFEYPPIPRFGTENDGETGEWWSAGTSRRTTTPGSSINFTDTFSSFGLESNNKTVPGVYRWRIDGGKWHTVDLSKVAVHANELAVVPSGSRGLHTVEFELISGRLEVDRWLAI